MIESAPKVNYGPKDTCLIINMYLGILGRDTSRCRRSRSPFRSKWRKERCTRVSTLVDETGGGGWLRYQGRAGRRWCKGDMLGAEAEGMVGAVEAAVAA